MRKVNSLLGSVVYVVQSRQTHQYNVAPKRANSLMKVEKTMPNPHRLHDLHKALKTRCRHEQRMCCLSNTLQRGKALYKVTEEDAEKHRSAEEHL